MTFASFKPLAAAALAVAGLLSTTAASAAGTVDVFYHAIPGSLDYREMGFTDENGNFISLTGQKILGARAEFEFKPNALKDIATFHSNMVVPVSGAQSQFFAVEGAQFIPMGNGKFEADLTSNLYNGIIVDGRFSLETFTLTADGAAVDLHGKLGKLSGFHFIVTRP